MNATTKDSSNAHFCAREIREKVKTNI